MTRHDFDERELQSDSSYGVPSVEATTRLAASFCALLDFLVEQHRLLVADQSEANSAQAAVNEIKRLQQSASGQTAAFALAREWTDHADRLIRFLRAHQSLNVPSSEVAAEAMQELLSHLGEVAIATPDENSGMAWWNGLSDSDRRYWLDLAGTARPASTWAHYKWVRL